MSAANEKNKIKSTATLLIVLLCGFVSVYFVSNAFEASAIKMPDHYSDNDLSLQGKKLKGFVFGGEGLIADFYWMRSLQYLGDKIVKAPEGEKINVENLTPYNPRLLYPYLDNSTDLDPHFITPYSYGAIVLPAIAPEQAIALAKKGIENNPNEWRLYNQLGYIYWRLKDYENAAAIYQKGSEVPGAPPFLKFMVGSMNTEGGSLETAWAIYSQMLEQSTDSQTKNLAQIKLDQVESDIQLASINKTLAKQSSCPSNIREIMPELSDIILPKGIEFTVNKLGELADKTGTAYKLDRNTCVASRVE